MFDPKGIKIGDKGGAGGAMPPMGDIMGKPLGGLGKGPDMGGDLGGGDLMGALKGAGYPDVTPDQVSQIEEILKAAKGGMDMGSEEPPMGGEPSLPA